MIYSGRFNVLTKSGSRNGAFQGKSSIFELQEAVLLARAIIIGLEPSPEFAVGNGLARLLAFFPCLLDVVESTD